MNLESPLNVIHLQSTLYTNAYYKKINTYPYFLWFLFTILCPAALVKVCAKLLKVSLSDDNNVLVMLTFLPWSLYPRMILTQTEIRWRPWLQQSGSNTHAHHVTASMTQACAVLYQAVYPEGRLSLTDLQLYIPHCPIPWPRSGRFQPAPGSCAATLQPASLWSSCAEAPPRDAYLRRGGGEEGLISNIYAYF